MAIKPGVERDAGPPERSRSRYASGMQVCRTRTPVVASNVQTGLGGGLDYATVNENVQALCRGSLEQYSAKEALQIGTKFTRTSRQSIPTLN